MSNAIDEDENPYELAVKFIMSYSEETKECDNVNKIN
jgi:hypothetical protein